MSNNFISKLFQSGGRARLWRMFIVIIFLIIISGIIDAGTYYNKSVDFIANKTGEGIRLPKTKEIPFRLGLDLLGGSHLVYRADMSQVPSKDRTSALEGVRDVIERRVNVFGVSEPIVQTSISGGEHRVIVELAGIKDVNEAINMIGETPLLEFKEEDDGMRELTEQERESMDEFNQGAEKKAEDLLGKLLSNGDFAALAKEYSIDKDTKDIGGDLGWITGQDHPEVVNEIKDFEVGAYTQELNKTENGYAFYKLEDKRIKTNPFNNEPEKEVKASHILICHNESEDCESDLTKEEAFAKAKELQAKLNPENFAELARSESDGPSAPQGGELGWFGRETMVKPFADTVFDNQEVGTISYVVETKFGYHLIYKQDEKDMLEYKVSWIYIPLITERDIIGQQNNWKNTELTGKNLDRAIVSFNPNDNMPEVSLEFDSEGSGLFEEITERNIGKKVAIFLDGLPISIPTVNEKITGGRAVISGSFNIQDAKLLAQRLNAGALPVPIELINQQTVGSSLGKMSLQSSLKAGMIGLIVVAIFMILYYRLPGLLAVISLTIYGLMVLAIFKIWPVTLTLSGMAGFILSIGMAVDANVLIFERLKEELRGKKPLSLAIEDSFNRAWPSIRDGNVSTLITCFILIQFSTSIVKGFAVTLSLGILISMFSAIIITKTFLQLISEKWLKNKDFLIGISKK